MKISQVIREPFGHFLLLGLAIFFIFYLTNPDWSAESENTITITRGDIDRYKQIFRKQWQRDPSSEELEGLIRSHLKEEVLYREALALGLEQDDTIVRRRLAQKMEFLITDATVPAEVDDKELMAYYEINQSRYMQTAQLSFTHIYFNPDQRGERLMDEAQATLKTLQTTKAGSNVPNDYGDRFMLNSTYTQKSTDEIAREFGETFATTLTTLTPGRWEGPVESGYGLHLVYVSQHEQASVLPFDDVRERVKNDYLFELRQERNEQVLDKLKERYQIIIEDA
jgi:peptidyl-prolyl cis-trans isomerase C